MGNTISTNNNFSINNGQIQRNVGTTFTSSGVFYSDVIQQISTSGWTQISSSVGGQYSYVQFYSADPLSTITIATDNAGTNKVTTLRPGYPPSSVSPVSGSATTYYAQSLPSASIIEKRGASY
jgi:hypothetical protein